MPLYDYDCAACGRRVEVVHGVHAPGPTHCPNCGSGPLRKAISAPAVHFKGSGWAKKERRAMVAPGTSRPSGESEGTADSPKGDEAATTTGSGSGDHASATESSSSASSSKPSEAGTAANTA